MNMGIDGNPGNPKVFPKMTLASSGRRLQRNQFFHCPGDFSSKSGDQFLTAFWIDFALFR